MDNKGAEMRQQIGKTMARLNEKLETLESHVSGTVKTVQDSVETVRSTLDIRAHVRQRPWTLMAGATVLGFLCASRLNGHTVRRRGGGTSVIHMTVERNPGVGANDCSNGTDAARTAAAAEPNWVASLGARLQPEIGALRGAAMGAMLEIGREILMKQALKTKAPPAVEADNGPDGKPEAEAVPARTAAARRRKRNSSAPA